ncbi:MAG: hypothetical protein FWH41_11065, partial [Treponema sp.]|nr:hypothetical protein [Treponema sp.]
MLVWLVVIPILIAAFLFILPYKKATLIITIIVQLLLFCCAIYMFRLCKEGEIITKIGSYKGVMGITLKADTLSSLFVMLTAFIFLVAALYSFNENLGRLYSFLMFIWEGLLIGIFLSGDFFNIFVLIEVSTVVVSILIMLKRDNRSMYDGMVYLMVNTVAIQFYLFGMGYIYKITGVLDMEASAQVIKSLDKASLLLPYALIITSISLKCALMPLFSWLPRAHSTPGAPSSVSAVLSGLHIKSGIYLFIRFESIFHEISVPELFLAIGIITGVVGFLFALSQTDIKLILAYHTISQIGMIMIGLSSAGIYSHTGGIYHIINHALFKSSLFLSAGIISHSYGSRDITKIRGVMKRLPLTGAAVIMAVFGITGAPFFNGSISKYFIASGADTMVNGAIILINFGTIVSFIKYSTILTGQCDTEKNAKKPDLCQQAAVLILGAI